MAERRGFAAMDENQRREIASMGGRAAHERGRAHEWDQHEAAAAGRKGGEKVSRNRQHMAEIGRKGGLAAHHRGSALRSETAATPRQPARQQGGGNGEESQRQTQGSSGQLATEQVEMATAEERTPQHNGAGHAHNGEGNPEAEGRREQHSGGNGVRGDALEQPAGAGSQANPSE